MVSGLAWFYMVLKYNTSDYSTYLMTFQVGREQRVGRLREGGGGEWGHLEEQSLSNGRE